MVMKVFFSKDFLAQNSIENFVFYISHCHLKCIQWAFEAQLKNGWIGKMVLYIPFVLWQNVQESPGCISKPCVVQTALERAGQCFQHFQCSRILCMWRALSRAPRNLFLEILCDFYSGHHWPALGLAGSTGKLHICWKFYIFTVGNKILNTVFADAVEIGLKSWERSSTKNKYIPVVLYIIAGREGKWM